MNTIVFYKFYHYVRLDISGAHSERFLNLCKKRGYPIWAVQMDETGCKLCMCVHDYEDTLEIQNRMDCEIQIVRQGGFYTILKRYRKREAFLLGLILCLMLLWFVNGFIWNIEVQGCEQLSQVQILSWLEQKEVGLGTKKARLSCQKLEEGLRENFEEIAWTSVKLEGTALTVEIKERIRTKEPEIQKLTGSYDLVASAPGEICSIYTRAGTAMAAPGDVVSKGAVLIRGSFDLTDDSGSVTSSCAIVADGDVRAYVRHDFELSIPREYQTKVYTGNQYRSLEVQIGKLRLPIGWFHKKYRATETICITKQLRLPRSFYLPVFYSKTYKREYYYKKQTYDDSQIRQLAEQNWSRFLQKFTQKGIPIIAKNVKIVADKKVCHVNGWIKTEQSIQTYKKNENPLLVQPKEDTETG